MEGDTTFERLKSAFGRRDANVAIIGLGYVGLPLAVAFAEVGFSVTGIDVDPEKCAALNRGCSYLEDLPSDRLAAVVRANTLHATDEFTRLGAADAVLICVPTPLNKTQEPNLSHVLSALEAVVQHGRAGQLVILESTTYPGTTSEVLQTRLEAAGYQIGVDCWLAFSPERIDPGNERYTLLNTPKIVGGTTERCTTLATTLYEQIVEQVVPVSSTKAAEMVKLLENTFRMVNIGLVNEFAQWCHRLGVDVWEVIEAASTKPFGFMTFYPGPGLGGHCIPVDPMYLSWKLRGLRSAARFIDLAREINAAMPAYVVSRVVDALNDVGKAVRGSTVLVLGVAYKANVADIRESPAVTVIELLEDRGATVLYADPMIPSFEFEGRDYEAVELTQQRVADADCIVITTAHDAFPWPLIVEHGRLIVDTRNSLAPDTVPDSALLHRL